LNQTQCILANWYLLSTFSSDELNLTEIAYKMRYIDVAHLSGQFKEFPGRTPSHFKKLKNKLLVRLEDV